LRFFVLSKIKNALQGQRFADISNIQHKVTTLLRGIPKDILIAISSTGTIVSRRA
jgi:hypothetical protein